MQRFSMAPYGHQAFLRVVFLFGLLTFAATNVHAQGNQKSPSPQQLLARDAGTWDCEIKLFFRGPQAPPATFKGVEENKLVSGGKFMLTTFSYPMGRRGSFEGYGLFGYDSGRKKFVGTWVDNMTAAPSQINAEYNSEHNTFTDLRTVVDGAGNELKSKQVTQWLDDSTKKLEIFMIVEDGNETTEVKLMEMSANKRKL